MYYSVFRFVYAHFIVAIIDSCCMDEKNLNKTIFDLLMQHLCGHCLCVWMCEYSKCFKVEDIHSNGFKITHMVTWMPCCWKTFCLLSLPSQHASIYFPKCFGPLHMWMGQSRTVYPILFLNLNLLNNYRDLEGAASTQLEQLGGDRCMTDEQS